MNLLREINAGGTTVLVATHDRELIRLVGRRTHHARSGHDRRRWREGARLRVAAGMGEPVARSRGRSAFAMVAIALALIVLGALLLVTWNAQRLLDAVERDAPSSRCTCGTTRRRSSAAPSKRRSTRAALTAGREYVSKAQALDALPPRVRGTGVAADAVGDNPFPASLEVRVRPDARAATGGRRRWCSGSPTLPGVADVRYDREWLAGCRRWSRTVRAAGLALASLMALAAAVTVAAVVRLGLHARRDEIEIMELVGAPLAFIRGPFVAEGFLQGGLGAAVALIALWLGVRRGTRLVGSRPCRAAGRRRTGFLPFGLCAYLVVGGMVVGSLGGLAASPARRMIRDICAVIRPTAVDTAVTRWLDWYQIQICPCHGTVCRAS